MHGTQSRSGVWGSWAASGLLLLAVLAALAFKVGPLFLPYRDFTVYSGSMEPTIPIGAEIFDAAVPGTSIRVGDVITFPEPDKPAQLVTHRVVGLQAAGRRQLAVTKGDANGQADSWRVPLEGTALRVAFHVPYLGYALNSLEQARTRILLLVLVGLLALLFVRQLWSKPDHSRWD